jgi:hypothetical protein
MLTDSLNKRRAGESVSSDTTITGAGVIITPRDVPGFTSSVIADYRKRT